MGLVDNSCPIWVILAFVGITRKCGPPTIKGIFATKGGLGLLARNGPGLGDSVLAAGGGRKSALHLLICGAPPVERFGKAAAHCMYSEQWNFTAS